MGDHKSLAQESKSAGNAAYKAKRFEEAAAHYSKAIELDPAEITFVSNLAAVRFEQKRSVRIYRDMYYNCTWEANGRCRVGHTSSR